MAISPILLASLLLTDEPQFSELARLGVNLKSALLTLFKDEDETLVSRAATLAGTLRDSKLATQLIRKVATHKSASVRLAAVAATEFLPGKDAAEILIPRIGDEDEDVREIAVRMITSAMPDSLLSQLDAIADDESESEEFRQLCKTLASAPPSPPAERDPIGPDASSLEELDLEVDAAEASSDDEDLIDDGFDDVRESDAFIGQFIEYPAPRDDDNDDGDHGTI